MEFVIAYFEWRFSVEFLSEVFEWGYSVEFLMEILNGVFEQSL